MKQEYGSMGDHEKNVVQERGHAGCEDTMEEHGRAGHEGPQECVPISGKSAFTNFIRTAIPFCLLSPFDS